MNRTAAITAGAAAALLTILGGIYLGQLSPGPQASAGHVVIDSWAPGEPNADTVCTWSTVLASPAAAGVFGFDAGGSSVYVRSVVCADPIDGGVDPGPSFAPGMTVVFDDNQVWPYDAGQHQLEAWVDSASAPWLCACARPDAGATCLGPDGGVAGTGNTLSAGQWSGAGCRPKSCIELEQLPDSGITSWPPECGPQT